MEDDYVAQLGKKLASARRRVKQGAEIKALKASAPTLFEIIDGEISLELNRGYADKPLGYEEYLESHGAVRGIRRIRDLMNAKEADQVVASQEAAGIRDNLKLIEDGKQQ